MERKIIMFYGRDCPHCHVMLPLAEKVEKESDVKIGKLEVWHNKTNEKKMREYKDIIMKACEGEFGVPAFVDETKKTAFCGEKSYGDLTKWLKI